MRYAGPCPPPGGHGPLWATPGRDIEALTEFFEILGPERCAAMTLVSADAAPWIAKTDPRLYRAYLLKEGSEQPPVVVRTAEPAVEFGGGQVRGAAAADAVIARLPGYGSVRRRRHPDPRITRPDSPP